MQNAEIMQKLQEMCDRVLRLLPEKLRGSVTNSIYVAGGAIASLVLDETPVDYDIFCEDRETAETLRGWVTSYEALNSGIEVLANTLNGVTFKLGTGEVVQVVTRFTGPPARVFTSFDFVHTKVYFTPQRYYEGVQTPIPAELCIPNRGVIEKKWLRYDGAKDVFTLNTLKRAFKFVARGWEPDNNLCVNLHRAIQNRPHIDREPEATEQRCGFYGSKFK